jgi:hypothetical protein
MISARVSRSRYVFRADIATLLHPLGLNFLTPVSHIIILRFVSIILPIGRKKRNIFGKSRLNILNIMYFYQRPTYEMSFLSKGNLEI